MLRRTLRQPRIRRHPRLELEVWIRNLQLDCKYRIHAFCFALDIARSELCLVRNLDDGPVKRAVWKRVHLHAYLTADLNIAEPRFGDINRQLHRVELTDGEQRSSRRGNLPRIYRTARHNAGGGRV